MSSSRIEGVATTVRTFLTGLPNSGFRITQSVMRCFVATLFRTLFGLRAVNVPAIDGAYILAPNHTSFLDPLIIQLVLPRHVTFLMDAELYRKGHFTWFYRFWGAIPISTVGAPTAGAFKGALRATQAGQIVGIFPEGRIACDGRLQEGLTGVALLMQRAGVPVIPVAILGAHGILPRHARFLRPGRLLVVFGHPIAPSADVVDKKVEAALLRDRVMDSIRANQARFMSWC